MKSSTYEELLAMMQQFGIKKATLRNGMEVRRHPLGYLYTKDGSPKDVEHLKLWFKFMNVLAEEA